MGKLHTLRRAILRDPENWRKSWYKSAWLFRGQWEPGGWYGCRSYGAFVESVLREIARVGNTDVGQGGASDGLAIGPPATGAVSRAPNVGSIPTRAFL